MQENSFLRVGLPAPTWGTQAYTKGVGFSEITSAQFKGKWLVLFFYPRDFTFVCPTELKAFEVARGAFEELGAEIVACSTDSTFSHKAWLENELPQISYPVLADSSHDIAEKFQVLVPETGESLRGTFIVDPEGVLRWMVVSDMNIGRSVDETLRVVQALQTDELCPANWHQGDETITV